MGDAAMHSQREAMVDRQLVARGISDERVLAAMRDIPRHHFVPESRLSLAYSDRPVPIGSGQTISQPYIVAIMSSLLSELEEGSKVLEIGSGSGYQTAVLVHMGLEVHAVEILSNLAEESMARLEELELTPASLRVANGQEGLPEHAPYDAIIAAACAKRMPVAWPQQITSRGIIVSPIGRWRGQRLAKWDEKDGALHRSDVCNVRFVPLVRG